VPSGLRSKELATNDEGRRHVKAAGGERDKQSERGKQSAGLNRAEQRLDAYSEARGKRFQAADREQHTGHERRAVQ
jgi:hypothetical protein